MNAEPILQKINGRAINAKHPGYKNPPCESGGSNPVVKKAGINCQSDTDKVLYFI
jgi:hypothetical protein